MHFLLTFSNVFGAKNCPHTRKNGNQWLRNQENMMDMAKSHIPGQ